MCCISEMAKAPSEHCPFPDCTGVLLRGCLIPFLLYCYCIVCICYFSLMFLTFLKLFIYFSSGVVDISTVIILCMDFILFDQKMNQEKVWGCYLCGWFWFLLFWSFGWQTLGLPPLFIRSPSATYPGLPPEPMFSRCLSDRAKAPATATK